MREAGDENAGDAGWPGSKIRRSTYPGYDSTYRCRPSDPKQRAWYAFDRDLALPEYLIEFEYERLAGASASAPVERCRQSTATTEAATPPKTSVLHYDWQDSLLLQVSGSKRLTIIDPARLETAYPCVAYLQQLGLLLPLLEQILLFADSATIVAVQVFLRRWLRETIVSVFNV